jgi:thiol-disulfide isomerase/thioredoxin
MSSAITTAITISVLVVLISILGYYYATGIWPGAKIIQQRPSLDNTIAPGTAKFMFFYASWCPYCRDAVPVLDSLKQLIRNSNYTYGGHAVTFEDINAYADKGKAALYKIKAYPTFKVETKDQLYEMVGKPTVSNFRAFLISALGAEKKG